MPGALENTEINKIWSLPSKVHSLNGKRITDENTGILKKMEYYVRE